MKKLLIFAFCGILFFLTATVNAAYAQIFKLELADPAVPIAVGGNFQVKILINTGGQPAINGDALLSFENTKLGITLTQTGNFFSYFSANPLGGTANKYLVSSWEESVAHAKSSTTDTLFATMTLTAKAAGTTSLSFDCTAGNEADSNINRSSDSQDVINCSSLTPLSLTIGGGGGVTPRGGSPTLAPLPTATPRPTNTPVPTSTPRPTISILPRSGTAEVTFGVMAAGIFLTVIGVLSIL